MSGRDSKRPGNLLIDEEGHLVHIDFGFILDISPGHNMGFESAAFKMSHEMTQLLDTGGKRNSGTYLRFQELDTIFEMEAFARENILVLLKEDAWWTKSTGKDWKPPALPGAEKSRSQVFKLTGAAN
ncbi:hypothetical protein PLESTB_001712700 [Pleodorina starrii]|uniref:PI3K/PI4K catalytic domain-containing protein n=1 Tax=Pleodorina starrii TaxID=330485 RepID=A0A9W6BZD6_9CHLO|nr:hypothetical protein PLESTB_001712700 [Pleodorina starrii]